MLGSVCPMADCDIWALLAKSVPMAQETKQRPVGRTRRDEKGERIVLNLGVKRAAEQSQCETIGDVGLGPTVCHRAEPSGLL